MNPERRGQYLTLVLTLIVALIAYAIGYLQGIGWHWGR